MSIGRDLDGRVALVTGAARNIGRAIALALADAGASVLVATRSSTSDAERTASMVRERGVCAATFQGDLADPETAARAIRTCVGELGQVDILVNNAALRLDTCIAEISVGEWRAVMSSILDTTFFCCQAALPQLVASDQGTIINFGGVAGHTGVAGRAHVATAKAGVSGLTRALAAELAGQGVTVNCISPGRIETTGHGTLPERFQRVPIPVGRVGQPREVAELVRFLAGPSARYLTGQTIHINGGWYMGG